MKNVHQYTVDRATNSARIGATNPIRKYVREDISLQVQLAGGELRFYDQGGQPIQVDEVPDFVLEDLRLNPLRRGNEKIEQVLKFCQFCPENDNAVPSGDYERHLERHILSNAAPAGADENDGAALTPEKLHAKPAKSTKRARASKPRKG